MIVTVSNDIKVEGFSNELLTWCKDNLEIPNPDFYKAEQAGRYTGNILKDIILYERRGNTLVLPFGVIRDIWHLIKHVQVITDFTPKITSTMHGNIKLYPYQEKARNALISNKNGILQAPCGSGKTQIGLAVIKELGQKALWVTHTGDLLKQSMDRAKEYFKGDFGTITAGKVNIGKDITFATVQTLSKLDLQQYAKEFSVIVIDECHRVAGTPTRVMQFYKVLMNMKARYKIGLSATVHRSDALIKSTRAVLGDIVFTITDKDVGDKIIKSKHVQIPTTVEEGEGYLDTDGTLNYQALITYLTEHPERNKQIADIVLQNNTKNCIVLSHRVEHLLELHKLLPQSHLIYAKISKTKRAEIFENVRQGNGGDIILATYNIAKEGLDIPNLDLLVFATPHKDYAIITQSAGRIERNIDGKKQPIIYDLVDENIGYCKKSARKRKNILRKR